jgi:polyisoprenoid-binding protein YceI
VSAARFAVDLTTLTSNEGRRDARLREMGIESARFPTATFVLGAPVAVPQDGLAGASVGVVLTGELDLHGVTKSVEIPAQARLADGRIEVAGSLTFPFADFGMAPPSIGSFVTVEDNATLEFLVILTKP